MDDDTQSDSPQPTPRKTPGIFGTLWSIVTVALVMATLFTLWTPANLFSNQLLDNMFQAWQANPTLTYPTPTPVPRPRIGIVAGHWGNEDRKSVM